MFFCVLITVYNALNFHLKQKIRDKCYIPYIYVGKEVKGEGVYNIPIIQLSIITNIGDSLSLLQYKI